MPFLFNIKWVPKSSNWFEKVSACVPLGEKVNRGFLKYIKKSHNTTIKQRNPSACMPLQEWTYVHGFQSMHSEACSGIQALTTSSNRQTRMFDQLLVCLFISYYLSVGIFIPLVSYRQWHWSFVITCSATQTFDWKFSFIDVRWYSS